MIVCRSTFAQQAGVMSNIQMLFQERVIVFTVCIIACICADADALTERGVLVALGASQRQQALSQGLLRGSTTAHVRPLRLQPDRGRREHVPQPRVIDVQVDVEYFRRSLIHMAIDDKTEGLARF